MKANNSRNKFVLTQLMTRIFVAATFALTSLCVPLMADVIAAPQPTLAATQTQNQTQNKFEGSSNDRNGQVRYNRTKNAEPSEPSYGAIGNTQRTVGTTENMSDRSTIKAKQKARQEINKAENTAE